MGCNKLEESTFKGYYRCENYMRGAKDEQVQKQKDNH